jgi:outer membrane lipoprotein-sorting protein
MKKYEKNISGWISVTGEEKYNGADCYRLVFDNPDFTYYSYTVKKDETVTSIAHRLKINDYMLIDKNSTVTGYSDVSEGQVLTLPNDYAKKMILLLDKNLLVPRYLEVYDDKGLYEKYDFIQIKINPEFTAEDFSPENKEYGF